MFLNEVSFIFLNEIQQKIKIFFKEIPLLMEDSEQPNQVLVWVEDKFMF